MRQVTPNAIPAQLIGWKIQPIPYRRINETTAALDRVIGTVTSSQGEVQWSAFRKRLHKKREAKVRQDGAFAPSDDPAHWNYWLRESEAYGSLLLRNLAPGLRAPVCYAQEPYSEEVTLWLEDIVGVPAREWSTERFVRAMRHVGRFQGRFVSGEPIPDYPWLSRGHLEAWIPKGNRAHDDLRYQRLADEYEALAAAIRVTPRTVCHFDLRGSNLFSGESVQGDDETILVDWSSVGVGALGEDIANAVFDSAWMNDVGPHLLMDLHASALDGYLDGLRDAGWMGDEEQVRWIYAVVAGLRFGLLAERIQSAASDPKYLASLESRYGIPGEQMLSTRMAICDLALDAASQALRSRGRGRP
jgi:hypothetical protein